MAKTVLRIAGRVAALLAVAIVASCSTKMWDAVHKPFPALPSLLENLHDNRYGAEWKDELTARLTARFPAGTPETDVMRALWLDGFQPMTGPHADSRAAVFTRLGDLIHDFCRRDGAVHWAADQNARLTAISGTFNAGCL